VPSSLSYQTDCQPCALREQCLAPGAKGNRARRVSAVRRLLPAPSTARTKAGPSRTDAVGGCGRTSASRDLGTSHWRKQYVEVLPLAQIQKEAKLPARPPRALRSRLRWRGPDRLACNAWFGPPQQRVTLAGVPSFLAVS
jgi:hypothetical protein